MSEITLNIDEFFIDGVCVGHLINNGPEPVFEPDNHMILLTAAP